MKKLPRKREHLGTFLGRHALPEDGQYLTEGPSGEANSNITIPGLYSIHGLANNPNLRKAEMRATDKTCQ